MHFMLDEMVPVSVASILQQNGHTAEFIRDYTPPGSPDPLVATISEEMNAVLVSFDGDFEKIAPRVPDGQQRRFKRLSRIWMRCSEYQSAQRLERALSLIESEYTLARTFPDRRMIIWIANGYIRTNR